MRCWAQRDSRSGRPPTVKEKCDSAYQKLQQFQVDTAPRSRRFDYLQCFLRPSEHTHFEQVEHFFATSYPYCLQPRSFEASIKAPRLRIRVRVLPHLDNIHGGSFPWQLLLPINLLTNVLKSVASLKFLHHQFPHIWNDALHVNGIEMPNFWICPSMQSNPQQFNDLAKTLLTSKFHSQSRVPCDLFSVIERTTS